MHHPRRVGGGRRNASPFGQIMPCAGSGPARLVVTHRGVRYPSKVSRSLLRDAAKISCQLNLRYPRSTVYPLEISSVLPGPLPGRLGRPPRAGRQPVRGHHRHRAVRPAGGAGERIYLWPALTQVARVGKVRRGVGQVPGCGHAISYDALVSLTRRWSSSTQHRERPCDASS
jgi:hypothetical protein